MTKQEIIINIVVPITGNKTELSTQDKTSLVAAINEVLSKQVAGGVTLNQKINSLAINFSQSII